MLMPVTYLKGDATRPTTFGPKIIAHIVNDRGGWGRGFVMALSQRWYEPERSYRNWYRYRSRNNFRLGEIQLVEIEADLWVCNMLAQKGYGAGNRGQHQTSEPNTETPLQYDELASCLNRLALQARRLGASVHMPRIGTGLAGGRWERVGPLVEAASALADVAVFVYDP